METEVHVARKLYRCSTRSCSREIRPGDQYTLVAIAPGEAPAKLPYWTTERYCSVCRPLPAGFDGGRQPCTVATAGSQCELSLDHHGAHQFPIGLF